MWPCSAITGAPAMCYRTAQRQHLLQPGSPRPHRRVRLHRSHVTQGQAAASAAAEQPAIEVAASGNWPIESMQTGVDMVQGPRESMEDTARIELEAPCGYLYASVFDGHNGSAAAGYLQQRLFSTFVEVLRTASPDTVGELQADGLFCPLQLSAVLARTYEQADDDLLAWLAKSAPAQDRDSGSTATTLLLGHDRVIVANVGDSRAVLCRCGTALDLTAEHRVYGRGPAVLEETERIEAVGGWVHDGRVCGVLAVSRAFGDRMFKGPGLHDLLAKGVADGFWSSEFAAAQRFSGSPVTALPEVTELPLQDGDEFVVLATDGLWDVINSQEVVRIVRKELGKGLSPQDVATKLCDFAIKRHTADNVAVVVVELREPAATSGGGSSAKSGGGLFGGLFGRR